MTIFVKGKRGRIAFHLAAELDKDTLLKVILEFANKGAFPLCAKDDDLTPLYVATRCESARFLVSHAQSVGYPAEKILSFLDEEKSTPLNSAADAGPRNAA